MPPAAVPAAQAAEQQHPAPRASRPADTQQRPGKQPGRGLRWERGPALRGRRCPSGECPSRRCGPRRSLPPEPRRLEPAGQVAGFAGTRSGPRWGLRAVLAARVVRPSRGQPGGAARPRSRRPGGSVPAGKSCRGPAAPPCLGKAACSPEAALAAEAGGRSGAGRFRVPSRAAAGPSRGRGPGELRGQAAPRAWAGPSRRSGSPGPGEGDLHGAAPPRGRGGARAGSAFARPAGSGPVPLGPGAVPGSPGAEAALPARGAERSSVRAPRGAAHARPWVSWGWWAAGAAASCKFGLRALLAC